MPPPKGKKDEKLLIQFQPLGNQSTQMTLGHGRPWPPPASAAEASAAAQSKKDVSQSGGFRELRGSHAKVGQHPVQYQLVQYENVSCCKPWLSQDIHAIPRNKLKSHRLLHFVGKPSWKVDPQQMDGLIWLEHILSACMSGKPG